ncbi:recombinase family protein [Priestia megaterium]
MKGISRRDSKTVQFKEQNRILSEYGAKSVKSVTGTLLTDKKELHPAFNNVQKGSVVVITNLSVVGVNSQLLLLFFKKLRERDIHLISVEEDIDTTMPSGGLFVEHLEAIVIANLSILKEKQMEGIERVKKESPEKYTGRAATFTKDHPELKTALSLFEKSNLTVKEISNITGISKTTIYDKAKEFDIKREKTKKN